MAFTVQITRELLPGGIVVRTAVFVEEQGFRKEFDETDHSAWHLLISDGTRPIAAGRLYTRDGVTYHIGRVAVIPAYRGQHLGEQVVLALEERARTLGAMKISLSAQCRAAGFYERLGYAGTEDFHMDENCPHVTMVKALTGRENDK